MRNQRFAIALNLVLAGLSLQAQTKEQAITVTVSSRVRWPSVENRLAG